MDAQTQAFESLIDELSATLADVVDSMKSGHDSLSEIGTTLVDVLEVLQARKPSDFSPLVSALRDLRINVQAPSVAVNVSPTPIQNIIQPATVQIIERVEPGDYRLTVKYDQMNRITEALVSRVKTRPASAKPRED